MKPVLRDYQVDLRDGVFRDWNQGAQNVCAVSATGSGKTVIMSDVIIQGNEPTFALAHRQELVGQISLALAKNGVYHNLVASDKTIKFVVNRHLKKIGRNYINTQAPVSVAGVDTLLRRDGDFNNIKYVHIDEGHHPLKTNKWGRAFDMFPNARGCGWTATPCRADRKSLRFDQGGLYHTLVNGPCMRDLITRGFLCDYIIYGPGSSINREEIAVSGNTGDFSATALRRAGAGSTIVGDVVQHYLRFGLGKRAIAFAIDIQAATDIASRLQDFGVRAQALSGKTDDATRAVMTDRFENGDLDVLVNVDLFGEGYDVPAVEVVIMGRPTESYGLYCLDPETEILTPNGWKKYNEIETEKECFGYDINTGEIKKTEITKYIKRDAYSEEKFYSLSGPHLDFKISDKHRLIVKSRSETTKNYKFEIVEETVKRKTFINVPVSGFQNVKGSGLTISELHFLGWFLSDGARNKKTNVISISQSVKKTEHLQHIEKTLTGCGFKYGKSLYKRKNVPNTHNNLYVYTVSYGKPRGRDKHLKGWSDLEQWIDKSMPSCYDNLSRDELLTLLQAINLGDGQNDHTSLKHQKNTLTINCGDNEQYADRLQSLCVLRGLRCNKARFKTWFILHIKDTTYSTIAGSNILDGEITDNTRNRTTKYKRSRIKETKKPAFVWCVNNELETIITRRNGKVIIMGNSQQFGRMLRPFEGKPYGILVDAVGNVKRHGLPDAPINWTLTENPTTKKRIKPMRACVSCFQMWEGFSMTCPHCGHREAEPPAVRSDLEQIEGDLTAYSPELLEELREQAARNIGEPKIPVHASQIVQRSVKKKWNDRRETILQLQDAIAWWAGTIQNKHNEDDSAAYRRFYLTFGTDVLTAQTGTAKENEILTRRIWENIENEYAG